MSERLRIGYIVKRFPRASETFIAQEILELERRGAEVTVLSLWPNDKPARHAWLSRLRAERVPCHGLPLSEAWKRLHRRAGERPERAGGVERALHRAFAYPSRRGRHRLCEAVSAADAAEERGLEHLHAHFANDPAFVALLIHRLTGLPFSFTAHAKDIWAKGPDAAGWRELLDAAAFAVTVSDDNRRHLEGVLGSRLSRKLERLYNGVDLESIRPLPASAADGPPLVLCVARLVEKKGIDVLLRALALLAERGAAFRAEILGDGPERAALLRLRDELGLAGRVEMPGAVDHQDAMARMRAARVFTLPARVARDGDRDALPTVLLEAMASGLPCVSTPVGGIPEIVVPGETGLLAPAGSPWALAAAFDEMLSRPALARRLGTAGRRRAEALFDRRRNVAHLHGWLVRAAVGETAVAERGHLQAVEGMS